MANLKYYNEETSEWETLVIGKQGPTGEAGEAGPGVIYSTTAPEDTSVIWYNTENGNGYIYYDDFWTSISGESSTFAIQLNGQIISDDYSIPSGYNGMSAGPITISNGAIVSIPAGSSWSIV
jgi:hypothetical protein